jgi:hypothetical protein
MASAKNIQFQKAKVLRSLNIDDGIGLQPKA